jgi:hypothetical protein
MQPQNLESLCFRDAVMKRHKNEITEDEYLKAVLLHCGGARHGENQLCNNDEPPRPGFSSFFADNVYNVDRFTASIAQWILKDVCKKDTRFIERKI